MRCWAPRLVMKSENALQQRMREVSKTLLIVLLAVIAAIGLWTRWRTRPSPALVYAAEPVLSVARFRLWSSC